MHRLSAVWSGVYYIESQCLWWEKGCWGIARHKHGYSQLDPNREELANARAQSTLTAVTLKKEPPLMQG